ncbi:MAG TPA: DUF5819 family protein [Streptomyces sp.]|nr:DUF5819 family protein [Streptomyces sp.]
MTALALACVTLVHLAMLFLNVAPPNAVTARYGKTVNAYVYPEFGQDWKLFAPDPKQRNDAVVVRVRTEEEDGAHRTWAWTDLTARDIDAIRGSLAPSHVHQNMLRRAWDDYAGRHGLGDQNTNRRGELSAAHLKRVVLQRVGRQWQGRPVVAVQVRGVFAVVPPPSQVSKTGPVDITHRTLPWWSVTDQDYRGL